MTKRRIRLLVLDPLAGRIFSCDEEGGDVEVLRDGVANAPDGICTDLAHGHLYGTLMGKVETGDHTSYGFDGSIWRMNLDASDPIRLVGDGNVRTPKQITADLVNRKLYWSDREGMRVMRCDLDGGGLETIFVAGTIPQDETDQTRWCVGIAVDPRRRQFYWTQKGHPDAGEGRICRAGYDLPAGATPETRQDVEVLFDQLPEPIDLEISEDGALYWSDRGDLSGGNSVCRAAILQDGSVWPRFEVIVRGVGEAIGLAVFHDEGLIFSSSLTGELYRARSDGSELTQIGKFGGLTGIVVL